MLRLMQRVLAAIIALTATACATQHDAPDAVAGSWTQDVGHVCTSALTFDGHGQYAQTYACPLSTGGLGVEVWRGEYILDGADITLLVRESSCGNATWALKYDSEQTLGWAVTGDTLTLSSGPNSMTLEQMADGDWLDGAITGCWSSEHGFKAGAMEPVKD